MKSIIGELPITEKQTQKLQIKSYQRISPYLEQCCVRASANVSYENAAKDVEAYTGIKVSAKTQQRIVHRYEFPELVGEEKLEEISLDGGKVRLRTEVKGESCIWKDYKAICANQQIRLAWFVENDQLVNWVNQQEFADLLTCLGDGHPGIWNLFKQINPTGNKQEILDWYHLIENLHKVGGSLSGDEWRHLVKYISTNQCGW